MQTNQEGIVKQSNDFPAELKKWNWGAFLLTWIWGLKHKVWLSLLVFVPVVNIVIWVMLGLKGNEWAWKKSGENDVNEFLAKQKRWGIAGFAIIPIFLIIGILLPDTSRPVDESPAQSSQQRPYGDVDFAGTASELFKREFDWSNRVALTKTWDGKTVEISGYVTAIHEDGFFLGTTPDILSAMNIYCGDINNDDVIIRLAIHQEVKVRGTLEKASQKNRGNTPFELEDVDVLQY